MKLIFHNELKKYYVKNYLMIALIGACILTIGVFFMSKIDPEFTQNQKEIYQKYLDTGIVVSQPEEIHTLIENSQRQLIHNDITIEEYKRVIKTYQDDLGIDKMKRFVVSQQNYIAQTPNTNRVDIPSWEALLNYNESNMTIIIVSIILGLWFALPNTNNDLSSINNSTYSGYKYTNRVTNVIMVFSCLIYILMSSTIEFWIIHPYGLNESIQSLPSFSLCNLQLTLLQMFVLKNIIRLIMVFITVKLVYILMMKINSILIPIWTCFTIIILPDFIFDPYTNILPSSFFNGSVLFKNGGPASTIQPYFLWGFLTCGLTILLYTLCSKKKSILSLILILFIGIGCSKIEDLTLYNFSDNNKLSVSENESLILINNFNPMDSYLYDIETGYKKHVLDYNEVETYQDGLNYCDNMFEFSIYQNNLYSLKKDTCKGSIEIYREDIYSNSKKMIQSKGVNLNTTFTNFETYESIVDFHEEDFVVGETLYTIREFSLYKGSKLVVDKIFNQQVSLFNDLIYYVDFELNLWEVKGEDKNLIEKNVIYLYVNEESIIFYNLEESMIKTIIKSTNQRQNIKTEIIPESIKNYREGYAILSDSILYIIKDGMVEKSVDDVLGFVVVQDVLYYYSFNQTIEMLE